MTMSRRFLYFIPVLCAAALVAQTHALHDDAGKFEHVVELAGEGEAGVGPLGFVGEVDVFVAVEEFNQLGVGFVEATVISDYRRVLGHSVAEFAP